VPSALRVEDAVNFVRSSNRCIMDFLPHIVAYGANMMKISHYIHGSQIIGAPAEFHERTYPLPVHACPGCWKVRDIR